MRKKYQQSVGRPYKDNHSRAKFYFLKSELITPACSHLFIVGLKNDIGRAVRTANDTTKTKSVVK